MPYEDTALPLSYAGFAPHSYSEVGRALHFTKIPTKRQRSYGVYYETMKNWRSLCLLALLLFFVGVQSAFSREGFQKRQHAVAWGIFGFPQKRIVSIPTPTPPPDPVRVPILMYHYVEVPTDPKDTLRRSLDVFPSTFESQLSTLLSHGYTPIFMKDLASHFEGKQQLPAKPIILTFDDGYRDFYTDAYPILQKYHVKATNYVISGFLGYPNYMTKDQVQAISSSGLVEVAAHTVHHVYLKDQKPDVIEREMVESKVALEQLINTSVINFAYPYGALDENAVQLASRSGFSTAVSTKPGIEQSRNERFILPRLRPGGRTGDTLIAWLESTNHKQDMW